MKYKHFKLLSFEEQKEYRHEQSKFLQSEVIVLVLFFLNWQNYLYGYTGIYALFTLIIIGLCIWQSWNVIMFEGKFKGIAKRKEKSLKELA